MASVSDRFVEIDRLALDGLGTDLVDQIVRDLRNRQLSLREVARRNNVTTGTVVQVARYNRIDPVTLETTA